MMQTYPMTIMGAKQLQEELARLKSVDRPNVINAIAEARSQGDLSENAEYDAAKDKQAFIEGRIADIEAKLSRAHVIDPKEINHDGRITFGATVTLLDLESDNEIAYQIVGDDEADVKLGKISVNSPVARSIIGKVEGDIVEVFAPGGVREYEITKFSFEV